MTQLSNKLDTMTIRVTSPDGRIMARLTNLRSVSVKFREDAFDQYRDDPDSLPPQLAAALNTLWNTYRDSVSELFAEAGGVPDGPDGHWDANRRRYRAERDALECVAMSPGRLVKMRCRNRTDFAVKVKPGALDTVEEQQFVAEINAALMGLRVERTRLIADLKDRYFDMRRTGGIHAPSPQP